MGEHTYQRVGFREIYKYDGADDWYEERCKLFKYRTVNCAFSDSKEVYIERRHRRCFRCAYYPIRSVEKRIENLRRFCQE